MNCYSPEWIALLCLFVRMPKLCEYFSVINCLKENKTHGNGLKGKITFGLLWLKESTTCPWSFAGSDWIRSDHLSPCQRWASWQVLKAEVEDEIFHCHVGRASHNKMAFKFLFLYNYWKWRNSLPFCIWSTESNTPADKPGFIFIALLLGKREGFSQKLRAKSL